MGRPSSSIAFGAAVHTVVHPKAQIAMATLTAAVIVVFGALLRLPFLGQGLWRDEGSTYAVVSAPTLAGVLQNLRFNEQTPPLYYLFEHGWVALAGVSEAALRLPSFIFDVAAIAVVYALGTYIGSRVTGTIAAIIAAIAPLALTVGMEARAYGLVLFLSSSTLYAFARASEARTRGTAVRWTIALTIALAALAATHFTGFVIFAALALVAVIRAALTRTQAAGIVLAGLAAAAVLVAPILLSMALYLPRFSTMAEPPAGTFIARLADHLNAFSPFGAMQPQTDLAIEIGTLAWLGAIAVRRRLDRSDVWALVLLLVIVFGIAASFALRLSPERHLSAYAPAAWVFTAFLLDRFIGWLRRPGSLVTQGARAILALGLAYVVIGGIAQYPQLYRDLRTPLSGGEALMSSLDDLHIAGPVEMVAVPDSVGPTLFYYLRGKSDIALRGVGDWSRPQFYSIQPDYWRRPDFEKSQLALIEGYAKLHQAAIVLAVDRTTLHFNDVPNGRGKQVTDALERAYGVRYQRSFPGRREPLDLVVLGNPR